MWIIYNDRDRVAEYEYPQTTVNYLESEFGRSFLKTSNFDISENIEEPALKHILNQSSIIGYCIIEEV